MSDDHRPHDDDVAPHQQAQAPHAEQVPGEQAHDEHPGEARADDDGLDPADDATPQDPATSQLRDALGELRAEADRITELGTGQEQVEAAERFAEDANRLDEQVGAAARAADADGNR